MQSPEKIKVTVRLDETSEPLVFGAKNAYTKGALYCIRLADNSTVKFPLCRIFSIKEEEGYTSQ